MTAPDPPHGNEVSAPTASHEPSSASEPSQTLQSPETGESAGSASAAAPRPITLAAGWRFQWRRWREQVNTRTASYRFPPSASAAQIRQALNDRLTIRLPATGLWGWFTTILVTILAAVMRLVDLDRPARIVFDETYYVRQAYSLLTLGYEGTWPDQSEADFADGDFTGLSDNAGPIVHPSVGKWMIAAAMRVFGAEDPVGWRLAAAISGIISVFLVIRIGRRLLGSIWWGIAAGFLLAIDGVHLVMSRISILDIFLTVWVLLGFYFVLLDRQWHRHRLARLMPARVLAARDAAANSEAQASAAESNGGVTSATSDDSATGGTADTPTVRGPILWWRPWLIMAGVSFGMATGVKWSGLYFVAVFGVVAVAWSLGARHQAGITHWIPETVFKDGVWAFLALVPTAIMTYLATWIPWFRSSDGLFRQWAVEVNASSDSPVRTWLPDSWNSWVEYHLWMWEFHNNLTSDHSYMSHPLGWLVQFRPTSFAWQSINAEAGADLVCGAQRCVSAVLAVGNPVLWWGGLIALIWLLISALRERRWESWAILAGYAAGYLPWLMLYSHRTIFNFYTVAFVPFVALTLAMGLQALTGKPELTPAQRKPRLAAALITLGLAALMAWFFWPIWTAEWIPYDHWRLRMFLPSWV